MEWIAAHVRPTGPPVLVHQRPWSTVSRVPTADGVVWFKQCAPVQGFEPSLSAGLSARWPERVAEVITHDEDRAWMLMRDAGRAVREVGNPPELWLAALPLYAELQRAECAFAAGHIDRLGVPDLRLVRLADRWSDLVERELPVEVDEKRDTFDLGLRVGAVAHAIASLGQREALPEDARHSLDPDLAWRLRHALAALQR